MPRYEFKDAKSHKFWEIEIEGTTFTVRYGRVGTDGQSNTKVFDSEEQAAKEAEKLTRSKVKKGYAEVAAVVRSEPDRNPSLEAAILEDPKNQDVWRVYADWLIGEGQPRGELIQAYLDGDEDRKATLHADHEKDFLGRLAKDMAPFVAITWARGFFDDVKVSCDYDTFEDLAEGMSAASVVGAVLRHPSARFLPRLRLGAPESIFDGEGDWQAMIDAVVKNGLRPSLRELVVGDFEYPDETEMSWAQIGSLKGLWAVLPNLRRLEVQGASIELGAITAPELEHLEVRTGGLAKEPLQRIGEAELPNLVHLEIWLGTEDYGGACTVGDLAPILAGAGLPGVRVLGLKNGDFANELPAALARSAILPRLRELDLSMGTMTDDGARALIEHADAFRHLASLNLGENWIGGDLCTQLRATLPNVTIGSQEALDDYGPYVSVGE